MEGLWCQRSSFGVMNMERNHFPSADNISQALPNAERQETHYYARAFRGRAEPQDEAKWNLLAQIFDFHFRAGNINEPFGPMAVMDSKRSLIPDDLSDDQLTELAATLVTIEDSEYTARVADTLWLRRRDVNMARKAVDAYLASAERLEDLNHWPRAMERYERALRLAKQIEPKGDLPETVLRKIESRVLYHDGNDPLFFSHRACELLIEFKFGDFKKLSELTQKIAEQAHDGQDYRRSREYFGTRAKLLNLAGDKSGETQAKIEIVESFIEEAEAREAAGSAMAAHAFWQDAINACRDIPEIKNKVPELQKRLTASGEKLVDEMEGVSHEIDLTDYVKNTQEKLVGLDWKDAFFTFVSSERIISEHEKRKEAEQTIADSPLQAMMPVAMFDAAGRKVGVRPPAITEDRDQREKALFGFVEWHAGIHRGIVVAGYLIPALRKLKEDHHVTASAVISLIENSPFIPPDRRALFFQGITAGFDFDFSTALHILLPQLENALRELLRVAEVDPYNVDNDGVQEAWGFKRMLSHEKLVHILGPDNIFELKSLLIEPLGQNMRNLLAHGLIGPSSLNSDSAVYLWWLILRLIVWPSPEMHAFVEKRRSEQKVESN